LFVAGRPRRLVERYQAVVEKFLDRPLRRLPPVVRVGGLLADGDHAPGHAGLAGQASGLLPPALRRVGGFVALPGSGSCSRTEPATSAAGTPSVPTMIVNGERSFPKRIPYS